MGFHLLQECDELNSAEQARLVVALGDFLDLRIHDADCRLDRYGLGFVAPHTAYQCLAGGPRLVIDIPRQLLPAAALEQLAQHPVLPCGDDLRPAVELLARTVAHDPGDNSLRYLCLFICEKVQAYDNCVSIRYLQEHFAEDLSISRLAALENYNVSYYNKWFKKRTGLTPSAYLRQLRIKEAQSLLAATGYGIEEIAALVGYSNHSAFSRAFRDLIGMTPHQYRSLRDAAKPAEA